MMLPIEKYLQLHQIMCFVPLRKHAPDICCMSNTLTISWLRLFFFFPKNTIHYVPLLTRLRAYVPKLNWADSGPLEPHLLALLWRCDSSSSRGGGVGEGGEEWLHRSAPRTAPPPDSSQTRVYSGPAWNLTSLRHPLSYPLSRLIMNETGGV